ncbi:protein FAM186A [Puma concolor]|uniref:Protein FAM186A n=1 Tax=Puma concolor TaxID=9696 RepID=A0A6P6IDJ6_PUMCO|nr:protein FAM186A [Puma concolor]
MAVGPAGASTLLLSSQLGDITKSTHLHEEQHVFLRSAQSFSLPRLQRAYRKQLLPGEETPPRRAQLLRYLFQQQDGMYYHQAWGEEGSDQRKTPFFIKMQSGIGTESESDKEVVDSTITSIKALYKSEVPKLEIPLAVQNVISRIEHAQLCRAREDINMQLTDILFNVQRIINCYTVDENVHSGRKISLPEHKKWRINFLDKIVTYAKNSEIREKTLLHILVWLEEWNAILSEMTAIDIEEHHHWIAKMEFLPEMYKAIESNVKILSRISVSLFEEKKRQKKKMTSRGTLWKSWKERVIKRPATAHALRPDQMISDEFATNTKVSEIQDMLQELINTAMFNKLENNAIKYISSTIVNLSKALNTLNDEVKVFTLQSANMYINETSEKEKELSLKIIRDLSEQNEILQQKLQDAEEKYEQFIWSKGIVEQQLPTALPTSTLKALPELSPQSSIAISKTDIEDSMENILAKEFENIIDEAQTQETKALGIQWDSAFSYTAPAEMTPDLIERQYPLSEKNQKESSEGITEDKVSLKKDDDQYQSQKKKQIKGSSMDETSGSHLSDDKGKQKETKLDHDLELQALENNRKERKPFSEAKPKSFAESKSRYVPTDYPSTDTKRQSGKSGTGSMWERLRKVKPEYSHDKSQISSESKEEPTTESMDKESKSEMSSQAEQFKLTELGYSSEKMKTKGKKRQISPRTTTSKEGKTEDIIVLAKKFKSPELVKSQSRIAKETSESTRVLESPDGKSEESKLEEFQKAIMAFLNEKIDNIGKPLDKKAVPKEELLLKTAEVEKLEIIKAKMEEYFQTVAETVAKILREYKDIKNAGQVGEKPMKRKKEVSFMPGLHFQKPISAKAEISTLLSSKSMDPLIDNLIQMILTEIEGERDAPVASTVGRDHKEKEKQRWDEYLQEGQEKVFGEGLKHHLQEEGSFWKKSHELISKKLEKEESWLQMKERKQRQQKQKWWQEEEAWKEQQKQTEQDVEQMQRKEKGYQKPKQQQLEAWNQEMEEQLVPLEEEEEEQMRPVQKGLRHPKLEINREKEEKQKPRRNIEDHGRQKQKKTKDQRKINEKSSDTLEKMFRQTSVTVSPKWKSIPKVASQLHQRKVFHGHLKTLENFADGKHPIPITPSPSTQSPSPGAFPISGQSPTKTFTLTPQQAQELEITITPQKTKELGITVAPEQAQALGISLTPEQAQEMSITDTLQKALGITVTPHQAQALGIPLTPEQAQAQGITLTRQQAQALGITLTPEQAQALRTTVTPQQAKAQGITLTPQQEQALGITFIPEQTHELGFTFTDKQAQAHGITLTPKQAQELGITLTYEQAQALGTTVIPQQSQSQGITLTPEQAQTQGITLTPEQAQAGGITLTSQQAQALGITLSPEQAQTQGITLTLEQAQALGITLTPQQAQAGGITLTPQQAQAQAITLTPQQAQAQGITLTPEQAQAGGITLTPQQAQAQAITLTPEQAQAKGITLTPEKAQAQGVTLTHEQAQAQGITLTPEKAQAQGITLTPQQAQALGITLTPQRAQALGITLTPQQAQAQGITLTPEQAQALGISLTPEQTQAQGVTMTPEQTQAQGITLTPEKAQALGITLTPQQAQAGGITLTPQQAQAQGVTLTPEQAQAQGVTMTLEHTQARGIPFIPEQAQAQAQAITLTPQQVQALGITLTPQQAQAQRITLTPQQAQAQGISLTTEQAQALGITLTPQQAEALGITLTPEQAQALGITLTPEQFKALLAQKLGIPITPENAWVPAVTLTPEQTQALGAPLSLEQAQALGISLSPEHFWESDKSDKSHVLGFPLTLEQVQPLGAPFIPGQSHPMGASVLPRQSPASAAIAEKSSALEVSPIPLQISQSPLSQAPGKSLGVRIRSEPGKLLAPQTFPSSKQTLFSKGQSTSVEFVAPEVPLTPEKFPIAETLPTSGQPPISGVPLTSAQIPDLLAPLSPRKPLVPGTSSIHGELLEPRPLILSEQPQAFQPAATCDQSRYLQAPSPLGQRQASPLWIPPTPGHLPTLWTSPTPGKPLKDLSSSVSKKSKERLAIISSLKPNSAFVHPSATDFKVTQAPFTTKKFRISEASDTLEEIPICHDPIAMEQFRTFQSYLTNYRTPVSQTPYIPTLMKPITSLPSLTTKLPKTSQISSSEWDQKSKFSPIDKSWILTSVSGTKKPKMLVPPSTPQELKEQRYFVDVEAQRKNLILLNQATKASGLPSQLHTTARNLIIETLHTDTVRLGYLFHKYIAYRLIQRARNNLIRRLQVIKNTGKGYETRNLYIMLSRIDEYQKKVMQVWTNKQKSLEQKRNQCLRKMIFLFSQLQQTYRLNLSQPIPCIIDKKQIPASTKSVQQSFLELLIEEDRKSDTLKKFRQEDQMEAIWNADLSTSSYPVTEKTSIHSLWAQLGGYPDIPMLLQLDVQSTFRKSLGSIKSHLGEVKRLDERQAVESGLIYSSFHYTTPPPLNHSPCTKLTPESTRNLAGDWPTVEPRSNLPVAPESNCGNSGKAATPPKTPTQRAEEPRERPRRQGTQSATRTPAPRPHGRPAGVRAPAAVGGVGRGSEPDRGGAAEAVGVAAGSRQVRKAECLGPVAPLVAAQRKDRLQPGLLLEMLLPRIYAMDAYFQAHRVTNHYDKEARQRRKWRLQFGVLVETCGVRGSPKERRRVKDGGDVGIQKGCSLIPPWLLKLFWKPLT